MGLVFLNVHTGERRNIADLGNALALIRARDWTIMDTAASPYTQGWEIQLNQAPTTGTYPNIVNDYARFTPDNLVFLVPRLGQNFTLRNLLAWANAEAPTDPLPSDPPLFPGGPAEREWPNPPNGGGGPAAPVTPWATVGIAAIVLFLLSNRKP